MRKIGEFLLANQRNAAIVAFLCTLSPLISLPGGFLASILVGFITLCRGAKAGLFILAWVALPAVALMYLHRFGVFDVLLLRCVLVWLFATVLAKYASWRLVLELAVVIGFVAVVGLHLFISDPHGWWVNQLTTYVSEMSKVTSWKLSATETQHLIQRFAPIATGITAFVMLFGTWLLLLLARWWQTTLFEPGALRKEFLQIRMSRGLALIALAVIVGALMKLSFVIDFFPVLLLPFMVSGLSFLHFIVTLKKGLVLLLILVYVGLLFLPFYIVLLLSSAGYFDVWFDCRKYIAKRRGEIL